MGIRIVNNINPDEPALLSTHEYGSPYKQTLETLVEVQDMINGCYATYN